MVGLVRVLASVVVVQVHLGSVSPLTGSPLVAYDLKPHCFESHCGVLVFHPTNDLSKVALPTKLELDPLSHSREVRGSEEMVEWLSQL